MSEPTDVPTSSTFDDFRGRSPSALWAIIAAFVAIATLYSIVVPPFETPDEIWHFAFIQHVAEGNRLPVSEADTQALWRQQGVQAPGYYLAAAAITTWIDQSDFPEIYARANPHAAIGEPGTSSNRNFLIHHHEDGWPWTQSILALHIARLFSVFLGAVTLWASYQAVAPILGTGQALAGVAVFAFIPQFIFISAAASNDNAVNALAALVLWRLVLLFIPSRSDSTGTQLRRMRLEFLVIGVLLGFAVLSKLSALGLLALTGLAVFYYAWRRRSLRPILEAILWIGLPVAAIAGWWYIRNWQLYGDPLAWNIWQANILLRVDTASWHTIASELTSLERSFWGLFGWLNVVYPDVVYMLLRAISLLIAMGWLLALARWIIHSRKLDARWLAGFLLLLWLLILSVSWLRFMRIAPAAQGRYFFPAAPSLVLLIAIGLHAWRVWTLTWLVAGLMLVLSLLTPFWIIAPAYDAPAQVDTTDLTPVEAHLGNHFTILGVDAESDTLQPGQQTTVRIDWRADNLPALDYSVFIHLVDEDGLIIAQRDTMPGGGLYPTSQWEVGETRTEEYIVDVPTGTYTPNRARWLVGMYDAATGKRLPVSSPVGALQDANVDVVADALLVESVDIAAPPGSLPNPINADFRDNVTLAGYELSTRRLVPGEEIEVTFYWAARGPVMQDYVSFAHLLDGNHTMHGGHDDQLDPVSSTWSTSGVIKDVHRFTVPESSAPGIYQLEIGLYNRPDFDRLQLEDAGGAEGADRLLLGPLQVRLP